MIDFVGYKAPASKVRLVGMDLLLVGLQVVMMGLLVRRREMEIISRSEGIGGVESSTQQQQQQRRRRRRQPRDTDEEERGGLSLSSSEIEEEGEEEQEQENPQLASSSSSSAYTFARTEYTTDSLLSPPRQLQDHPLDTFHSGQYIIANIHLGETLRKEWKRHRYPAESSTAAFAV